MVHNNPAELDGGTFVVDRKFHEGLTFMASEMGERITSVHPRGRNDVPVMDPVRVKLASLPYDVLLLDLDAHGRPVGHSKAELSEAVSHAGVVVGQSFEAARVAREARVPYVALVEYDLPTQIVAGTAALANPLRRLVRAARIAHDYYTAQRADLRGAWAVHCNGYPIYEACEHLNRSRVLYLDSRLSADSVITPEQLQQRLDTLGGRPLRLLYSGRFTAMKGVVDVVKVAIACQRRGIDVELSLYGQGEDLSTLRRMADDAPNPSKISIHDPVPFPELLQLAKQSDLFVCCHIQSDPSCTYIESLGAGLPIVGYGNRMWKSLHAHSGAGLISKLGDIDGVVEAIEKLVGNTVQLARLSRRAQEFALSHCFETETGKRVASMQQALLLASQKI